MKMPDLAATGSDIRLVRWLAQPGQTVKRGQPLLEVETDKALSTVESIITGVLREVSIRPEDMVSAGQVIALFEVAAATPEPGVATTTVAPSSASVAVPRSVPMPAPTPPPPAPIEAAWERRLQPAAPPAPAPPAPAPIQDRSFLLCLFERMVLIRQFEERVKFLFLEGTMPGTIHQCQGQEATAVGVCAALQSGDWITSTFRGHGHALAKGLTPQELLDELFGARTGCCQGKGGSMHVGNPDHGMLPGIAIVAGGIPLAAGMALAFRLQKSSQVVACFFGDGALAEGAFHEGVNLAALWRLPAIFVCENNLYGASTHIGKVMRNTRIADRAAGYGFRGETVDGNDVLAVYDAARRAAADGRAGRGPVLLELLTYRLTGHSRRDPCHYQPKEEREAWLSRDPIQRFAARLQERGDVSAADLEAVNTRVQARIEEAVAKARLAPQPTLSDLETDVLA
ncbi:MAG TPA: thiamine pyrophosphate-dependent enzyme [Dongiaceae bacterium]|nr:thiamine pyrophosphate-dependent enzyme [Dongiaceae bacterium]